MNKGVMWGFAVVNGVLLIINSIHAMTYCSDMSWWGIAAIAVNAFTVGWCAAFGIASDK